jgi:peptide subunit release factor 1 (eRF1)
MHWTTCHYLVAILTAHCPLCDTRLEPQVDIVERAVERAVDQKATIEVLRGEARQALAAHGHIGALLRSGVTQRFLTAPERKAPSIDP